LKEAAAGLRIDLVRFKEIKSYSPGVSHVVLDVRVFRDA
jgi:tRNA G37 N-methylase Trm5